MRRFYKDGVVNLMEKLGMTEGVPIESKMVSNAIKRAQKKVEDYATSRSARASSSTTR